MTRPDRSGRSPSDPDPASDDPGGSPVLCPHCGSTDVKVEAAFGGSLMTRQYWCEGCRTVFEWVRWEPDDDPGGWLDD